MTISVPPEATIKLVDVPPDMTSAFPEVTVPVAATPPELK
jgi:hypothetical protein